MNDDAIAIRAQGLGKCYQLGETVDLMRTCRRLARRFRGRTPDPRLAPDAFWALRDIDLEIPRGAVLGIIGRNGAGKSTLLKILARITEPTSGRAVIHGRIGSLLEVGTGFNPQLTGRENIYLNGVILGMRKAEVAARFDDIVAFSGVEAFLDTPVKRYSSGMRVRLAFAVAAHLEPEILLIDEVLSVGDAEFQAKCLGKMDEVTRAGRTVLFVSHNMGAITTLVDSCIWLDGGRVVLSGSPREVVDAYITRHYHREGEHTYPEDLSKDAQITRIAARDVNGAITGLLEPSEPLAFDIEFVVRQPYPQMHVALMIETQDGIFISDSATSMDPSMPATWPIGRHALRVTFPPILNAGRYTVRTGIGRFEGPTIDAHRDGLLIELAEHSPIGSRGRHNRKLPGILSVIPQYQTLT